MRDDYTADDREPEEDDTPDPAEQTMREDGFTSFRRWQPRLSTVPRQSRRSA